MQQVWEAIPWLEVKHVVAVNHTGVAHCLSNAYSGCWCSGHASCDKAIVLWPKGHNVNDSDCLVSSSFVIPKLVKSTCI